MSELVHCEISYSPFLTIANKSLRRVQDRFAHRVIGDTNVAVDINKTKSSLAVQAAPC